MRIDARTRLLGLFGWPVEHSLSPAMHNAAFEEMGLNFCYVAMPVRPEYLRDAVRGVRALGMRGVNVTVPHKERVIEFIDETDEEAKFIGAVNTVVNDEGRLRGFNTDGRGFIRSLAEQSIGYEGKRVVILGAGGACRAIGYYLSEKALSLSVFDIDAKRLERLVGDLSEIRSNVHMLSERQLDGALMEADMIINATPLGLKKEDPLPVSADRIEALGPHAVVGDLIYKQTPLLALAKARGLRTFDGLGMLLWQGVLASEHWTGVKPPHETMRRALLEGIGA